MSNINDGLLDGARRLPGKFRDLVIDGGLPGAPLGYRLRGATLLGAPATGTWRPGDMVPDRAGNIWSCVTGGTPGTWVPSGGICASLNAFGADPTGTGFSDAAMAAARAFLATVGGGNITAEAGTYKFANSYSFGVALGIATGLPNDSVIFKYTGSGTFLFSGDPSFNTGSTSPLASNCGPMTGFTVDGTSAGSGAVGLQVGDQNLISVNVGIQNFTGAAAIGFWVASKVGWINYSSGSVTVSSVNCTNHVVFGDDGVSGGIALGGINWTFYQTVSANQNGIVANSSCQSVGGTFALFGEYLGGSGTNTGAVLSIGADSTAAGFINFSSFDVNVESATGAGNVGHTTIKLGSSGVFYANYGQLIFRNPSSASFQASTGLSTSPYFSFDGFVLCQTSGDFLANPYAAEGVVGWARTTMGGVLEQIGTVDSSNVYVFSGSVFTLQLSSGANTRAMYASAAGKTQRIKLNVVQPASGSAGTLTLTGVKTVNGSGGFTLSATNGYIDTIDLWWDGTNWYGAVAGLHFH